MGILSDIIPFLFVLGVLIFVHELGHFAVAKFCGVKVETFSLGFGKRLFGFTWGDTDYRISAIPLGGYVKMKGENLDEKLEHSGDEFLAKPKWQRFLILLAGPWMNIVAAIAIPTVLAMYFHQEIRYYSEPVVVGSIAQGSSAEKSGIQPGDHIVKFDNLDNPNWRQVEMKIANSPEIELKAVVERNGQQIQTSLTPKPNLFEHQKIGVSGLWPQLKEEPVYVDSVVDGSPAKQAGLQANDKIVKLNGETVKHFNWFYDSIQNQEGKEINITVERNNQLVDLKMHPRREEEGRIRVGFTPNQEFITPLPTTTSKKSLPDAFKMSLVKNYEILVMTKEALGQIFTGHRKAGDTLSGPIQIAAISGKVYKNGGIEQLFSLMGVLSLNLGVFNLFPIPVLDGGHIFILLLEALLGLGGYKLSMVIKERMLQVGFVMLFLLMGFVIINDVSKVFIGRSKPAATKPAPAATTEPAKTEPAKTEPAKTETNSETTKPVTSPNTDTSATPKSPTSTENSNK